MNGDLGDSAAADRELDDYLARGTLEITEQKASRASNIASRLWLRCPDHGSGVGTGKSGQANRCQPHVNQADAQTSSMDATKAANKHAMMPMTRRCAAGGAGYGPRLLPVIRRGATPG